MAASSSDLQALQLENRNLQQKLDWKQLKINQLETKVRDLRDGGLAANLERLERSLCRLSLQMEHVQLVIKKPEWSFHTFAMPETTASSAHTIFVRPPSGERLEVTIPPGKLPGELFTVMLKDEDAFPPDWPWDEEEADEAALRKKAKAKADVERRKEQRHAAAAAAGREPGQRGNPNWVKSDARPARPEGGSSSSSTSAAAISHLWAVTGVAVKLATG
ncbi:hypothetical protein EMIHUDRAFT_109157 [Emiliania huxleyi CCMP1516]|uniref:CS domain-containing protein n=2 Tax=Emiliania huxleyi TaxID=2903 RepID=A0A0D3KT49_EMIH1|nr:hypothetical protein EMIHUDRAFT_109157 [Emiliania huxleyi CCMP1516]EOD38934.1 hypothetical protein EMIHUDRAFT_109157 [Emiliania huxleyi CCMP1516]|eukprot:XP_005791363.1 hypothetical protein EMIHUDRAFT_109157 [Emiliania huxleyi CCMP1516]